MNYQKWFEKNTASLKGKTVAISGSTGGLGAALCEHLARLGADLLLLNRSEARSEAQKKDLEDKFGVNVSYISLDLENMSSVDNAVSALKDEKIDVLIHNAGAYSIPRKTCDNGYDNVFTINFVSPYVLTRKLLPGIKKNGTKVVIVGSIAHNYSKIDVTDVDFSTRKQASKVYGNAKRYIMTALPAFLASEGVKFAVTHPGITFTNITAHYPKLIFAIIKHPMKIIFMSPKKAALTTLLGVFQSTAQNEWIGPCIFNVWGLPKKKRLDTIKKQEIEKIKEISKEIYKKSTQGE